MAARQSPATSHDWAQTHTAAPTGFWLSADYTDFNKEHRWWEQAAINTFMAMEWESTNTPASTDKAAASWHVAKSYLCRQATTPDSTFRVLSGLFSGERNTARDNTILHKIYSLIAIDLLPANSKPPTKLWVSGDDEDGLFPNKSSALTYCATLTAAGWHLNPTKQLYGHGEHEFLQTRWTSGELCRPLAPLAYSLTAWSWYKPSVAELEMLPRAAYDHTRAVLTRNGDAAYAWLEHRKALNSLTRRLYKRQVRWDAALTTDEHAILNLRRVPNKTTVPPAYRPPWLRTDVVQTMPGRQTYWASQWELLQLVPPGERQAIKDAVDADALQSWFRDWQSKHLPPTCWPDGKTPKTTPTFPPLLDDSLALRIGPAASGLTKATAAAMAGAPVQLINALARNGITAGGNSRLAVALALTDDIPPHPLISKIRLSPHPAPWM